MYNSISGTPTLTNCILWGNTASTEGPQVYNYSNSAPNICYSLVQDSGGSSTSWDSSLGSDCGQNIDTNTPTFVVLANGNLSLTEDSPAIDAGNNAAVPPGITTDLAGKPRICNNIVDMGAYEFQTEGCTQP